MKKYLSIFTMFLLVFIIVTNTSIYAATKKQKLSVYYEKDVKSKYKDYKRYKLKEGKPEDKVFFVTNKTVKNFKLFDLEYKDIDSNGKIIYDKKLVYTTKKLTPKKPLLADIYMFGNIPKLGISYIDNKGKTQKYIIYQSGKDGSVGLSKEDF